MAFQKDTKYVGRQGNVIAYERLDDYLIRTVPIQAANSKKTAAAFGLAASVAKDLRISLSPVIPNPRNKDMQNRLTAAMRLFLSKADEGESADPLINPLTQFRFMEGSSLTDFLWFPLDIGEYQAGKIPVGMPAIRPAEAIVAPAGTVSVQIRIMAVAFHPGNGKNNAGDAHLIEIPYTEDIQNSVNISLDCTAAPEGIVAVAASLRFLSAGRKMNQQGHAAADILRTIRL